ncbi:MAG: hypothetical protein DME71_06375 [Verrucomicrobia bacterium]|nr:MAG: hypothetical protein DME71_06375 [Verrucomicrobiota bacterium]
MDKVALPDHCAHHRSEGDQRCHHHRSSWIPPQPFPSACEEAGPPRPNWFVLKPAFKIFGEYESGGVTALWIFF